MRLKMKVVSHHAVTGWNEWPSFISYRSLCAVNIMAVPNPQPLGKHVTYRWCRIASTTEANDAVIAACYQGLI